MKKRCQTNVVRFLLVTAGVAVFALTPARATTITVQSTGDGAANAANCPGAGCRLRDAIADANNGDTIDFAVSGAITLNSGELVIGKNITINGPGALSLAVDGNSSSRVFHIGLGMTVTISNLTIRNGMLSSGQGGGGIYNDHATLTLNNCAITGNYCSAVLGGGIYSYADGGNNATLTVNACTLSGNTATGEIGGVGGAIAQGARNATGNLYIINSTISGNAALGQSAGGGVSNEKDPGGTTNVTVNNSTFSGNSVGINNSSGAAIYSNSPVNTANSIYDSGQDIDAAIVSLGYNISIPLDNSQWTGPGDQPGADPRLGPLQNNGGQTSTHAPLCGSPAIDHGKNLLGLSTDQRGAQRTFDVLAIPNASGGDGTDVGAVESPINTFFGFAPDDSGPLSLRQAIINADNSPGMDLIVVSLFQQPGPIILSSELSVNDCACIQGPGADVLAVSGNNNSRVFHIEPGIDVSISGLTIENGNVTDPSTSGAGVFADHSNVSLDQCLIGNNSAVFGGGIGIDGSTAGATGRATLTLSNSTVSGNTASNGGGGIFNYASNSGESGSSSVALKILNSTVNNNTTPSSGGGVENYGIGTGANGLVAITNSTLSANSAPGGGGGIYNFGDIGSGIVTINNSTLSGNTATFGGAVYNTAEGGTAALNTANTIFNVGASGGTIFNVDGSVNSSGYNLASDGVIGLLTGPGDIVNTNPQLGPLQNNGGPTATHALMTNSPAREAGNPNFDPNAFDPPLIYDQRGSGFPRVLGRLDIGAVELPAPLALSSAESLAIHISINPPTVLPFFIDLPLSGNPGIECRSGDGSGGAGSHTIIFFFNNQITSIDNASVSCGSVTSFGLYGNPPTTYGSVQFNGGTCNQQYVTVTLTGVHDTYGQTLASASATVGLLLGDTTGNGTVSAGDVSQTKFVSGSAINSSNFREDVNIDTALDSSDVALAKFQSGTALPPPPISAGSQQITQQRREK